MTDGFKAIINQGEYISTHYLETLLKSNLDDVRTRWGATQAAGLTSSAQGVKGLDEKFIRARNQITERLGEDPAPETLTDPDVTTSARALHDLLLTALAFHPPSAVSEADTAVTPPAWLHRGRLDVHHQDTHRAVAVALAVTGPSGLELVALETTWCLNPKTIVDRADGTQLLDPIRLEGAEEISYAGEAVRFLFACEDPPRYVLLLAGMVLLLADREAWPNSYLAVDLNQALAAHDSKPGGELETIAALFGAESLLTAEGRPGLTDLVEKSRKHAVSVSKELREALRQSVQLIAQEILNRMQDKGVDLDNLGEDLAGRLAEQALRYLYRILFLLYAEARPELGILPSRDESYQEGYGIAWLGNIVSVDLPEDAEEGTFFYESLGLLFTLVDQGYRPRRASERVVGEDGEELAVDAYGIRFEALRSDLFRPDSTELIGDETQVGPDRVDTRLRNKCLWQVLNLLMLTPEPGKYGVRRQGNSITRQRGFISYAQLGINQLGAVYEGLMSYTGFFAPDACYEVAKTITASSTRRSSTDEPKEKADPSKGTWIIPISRANGYEKYLVKQVNPVTGVEEPVIHDKGSFVYRLSGRERQRSASYYTPEVLTACTVRHALSELIGDDKDQHGNPNPHRMRSRDILDLTICEPALGSGAFLNEAINQLTDAYLARAQEERGQRLLPDQLVAEKQKVRAHLALHNCYGIDLNATAVELAEVSIWLNVMHAGLEAPWFGLHLRRGNSLIGARRAVYHTDQFKRDAVQGHWRTTPPVERPLKTDARGEVIDQLRDGEVHHFLLPAQGWGAVVGAAEATELAPEERAALLEWRRKIRTIPSDKKTKERLTALAQRVERLWGLTRRRIEISEDEIRRDIDVWGIDEGQPLPKSATGAVTRREIEEALHENLESPYNRLKTVMDAWCALWFWPVGQGIEIEPPTLEEWIDFCEAVLGIQPAAAKRSGRKHASDAGRDDVFGLFDATIFAELAIADDMDRVFARGMSMDKVARDDRFSWWSVLSDIAQREGFFHWELDFAPIFLNGGFDLQVGNPPWVRPVWDDKLALAEYEPWFYLQEKIPEETLERRRQEVLGEPRALQGYLFDLNGWAGLNEHLGSVVEHPMLSGVQTNLYTNFMERVWRSMREGGIAGLIHEEQHFADPAGGPFRAQTYPRLRRHFQFGNNILLFDDVDNNKNFGINIYGEPREISFKQMARVVRPDTVDASINFRGEIPDEVPGIQYPHGGWDFRPHPARVLTVTTATLRDWAAFADEAGTAPEQARGLRPLTVKDNEAIRAIAHGPQRLGTYEFWWSPGLHEKGAKKAGVMKTGSTFARACSDMILQGPHFAVATPFAKEPNENCKSNKDYSEWDLVDLAGKVTPRTSYQRSNRVGEFQQAQRMWGDKRANRYWRVVWRNMVVAGTERTHQAALLPPGPTHVHTVHSMALADVRKTAIIAGLWASLPFDFICKVSGTSKINIEFARQFPAPLDHPLTTPLLLRTLRLNCLTLDYASIWHELFDERWFRDGWAASAKAKSQLHDVEPEWSMATPLRSDYDRRMALVEIDALVALMLDLTEDQIRSMYRSQFGVLRKYEWEAFYAADGHKIGAETHNRSVRQTDSEVEIVKKWKKAQLGKGPQPEIPEDWVQMDRANDMADAYNEFRRRLEAGDYDDAPADNSNGTAGRQT